MRWPPPEDWPHVATSRQVYSKPHRWHVQETGSGPALLLLHGAGGSTHSFRDLIPLLSPDYRVIALDLPGQGFTRLGARHRSGLEDTAQDIKALCLHEGWEPKAIIGHSAGGALALRLSQVLVSPEAQPPDVIGINPALDNFKGIAGVLFPVLAKLLSAVPFTAQFFSATASGTESIAALIRSTGSDLTPEGLAYYRRLIGDRDHADATLIMMAQWSLDDLSNQLPRLTARVLFLVGDRDKTVPPSVSDAAAAKIPDARVIHLQNLGHLAHEEDPGDISERILAFLTDET